MASDIGKAEFDESKHPRDHGRFATSEGAQGDSKPSLKERAAASMADPRFRAEHADRLAQADTEARRNFPRDPHSEEANHAVSSWQHSEAQRIYAEQDAHQGYAFAAGDAHFAALRARNQGGGLVDQHEAAMAAIRQHAAGIAQHMERNRDAQSRGFASHAAEQAHFQAQRDEASRSRGFANEEAERAHHEAEQAKATRASEDAAIAAGHVSGGAREIGDRYEATLAEHERTVEGHAEALDKAHGEAADALSRLHEYGIDAEGESRLEHATPSLSEEHADTQRAFHDALSGGGHDGYERESFVREPPMHPDQADLAPGERYQPYTDDHENAPFANHHGLEYVPHPDDSEHEQHAHQLAAHEQWKTRAEAAYNEALAAHEAEFQRRAVAAQDALERLHEHQVAAHEGIKASGSAAHKVSSEAQKQLGELLDDNGEGSNLVNHEAFARHERDYGTAGNRPEHEDDRHDPQYVVDDKARADYENAHAAGNSMVEHAQQRLEEGRRVDTDESLNSLRDSMRSTGTAIKELATITRRPAKLAGGKPGKGKAKKSTNRPGAEPGGSVWGMAAPNRFKLKLTKLDLISLVDTPAQESAAIRLIKRKDGSEQIEATLSARLAKIGEGADPLAYFWAFTCTSPDGAAYHDLQGDAIQPDFLKAAEDWLHAGGAMDEMHDGAANNRAAFAFPWDSDIATAMLGPEVGKLVKTSGLMIAMRPTPEQLVKLLNKEFNGISIAGTGVRELVKAAGTKCPGCGAYGKADGKGNCPSCGKAMKRARRTKRPVPTRKQAVLTSAVDGHQHQIDLDDPADGWSDQLTTSYNTSEGADSGHQHAWVYDAATGKITIAEDSGHNHTIDAVVPADVIRQAALNESGERCPGCGEMCEADCRFCPKCGRAMDRRDAMPAAVADEGSGSAPAVIVISARAPAAISPPSGEVSTVKDITEEQQMADPNELAALKAENALLKHMSSLTDAARDHHNRLLAKGIKSDADAFLVLDKAQRAAVLAEIAKSDAEVYTSKSNGKVYRMSDSVEIIEAAKQSDAMAETMKRLETERSEIEFTKAAIALIPNCLKGVKNNVPQRLIKAARAEFKDAAEFAEFEKAMKQYEAALAMLSKSVGYSSVDDTATDTPAKRFESAINDYAKRNNLSIPAAIAKATESDAEIRRLYNEASLLAS